MSPSQGPFADSQLGLWKSTNSVGNIKTQPSSRKQFLADEKGP